MKFEDIKLFFLKYKNVVSAGTKAAEGMSQYAITRSPFSLVSGAISAGEQLFSLAAFDPGNDFSQANGWVPLTEFAPFHSLLLSTLDSFPGRKLHYAYWDVKMYDSPFGTIIVRYDRYDIGRSTLTVKKENRENIIQYLSSLKVKELGSPFISFDVSYKDEDLPTFIISTFKNFPIPSLKSKELIDTISSSMEKGINRSFMLYGLPGTGKTTLAQTIIDHFGMKTLKVHPNNAFKISYFVELLDLFKIEALILDDFDQIKMNDHMLQFLETANRKLKLVIGIANKLKKFDPAVLRPGRFDEIIKIEELEEETVKNLLGHLSSKYFKKVKSWPVAYIQELVKQSTLNPHLLPSKFNDLEERFLSLKKSFLPEKEKEEDNKDPK